MNIKTHGSVSCGKKPLCHTVKNLTQLHVFSVRSRYSLIEQSPYRAFGFVKSRPVDNLGSIMWSFRMFLQCIAISTVLSVKEKKNKQQQISACNDQKERNLIQYSQAFKKVCCVQESVMKKMWNPRWCSYDGGLINPLYPDFCMRLTNTNGIRSLEGPCNPVALIWHHGTINWASSTVESIYKALQRFSNCWHKKILVNKTFNFFLKWSSWTDSL